MQQDFFAGEIMKKVELIVIGLDGAVSNYIVKKAAKGILPNFAGLLKSVVVYVCVAKRRCNAHDNT